MKKKATIAAFLTLLLCLSPFTGGAFKEEVVAQGSIEVWVKGKPLELATPAYIHSGTTLVPLREIAEALGAKVEYAEAADGPGKVTIQREGRSAAITIGSATMATDGKNVKLPLAPRIENAITMVPLRALSEALGTVVAWDGAKRLITIDEPKQLPTVGTSKKLMELLQASMKSQNKLTITATAAAETSASLGGADSGSAAPSPDGSPPSDDYSTTNVQVDGVDEADWAKTDGGFVYQISGSRVIISDIADASNPKLVAVLEYDAKEGFQPQELYVDDKHLIVIGQRSISTMTPHVIQPENEVQPIPANPGSESAGAGSSGSLPSAETTASPSSSESAAPAIAIDAAPPVGKGISILPYFNHRSLTVAYVYELKGSAKPELVRELSQEGGYVSSRKIGDSLYMVSNKYSYYYPFYDAMASKKGSVQDDAATAQTLATEAEPFYGDSAANDELLQLPLSDVHYFPEPADSSMMIVGAVDLSQPDGELQISAYLGSGNTIYASQKHLYVAIAKYEATNNSYSDYTEFHKFRLDQGRVVYIGQGTVPGSLLNQFSMDEHEGYFRVALTSGNMWASGEQGSKNNVYVLDEKLSVVGKLEGLAPGERIYSVRFMGARAYMVTFRNVDPLFVVDLSQPMNPAVLGQLKIPGYSDYLHPYDENHIIGFGKETVEVPSKGMGPDETMAFYQGMKIAMFDVSDVTQPKELFKEVIGDRGTGSELLYNHKALLFSKAKGLMAFPVELYEIKNKEALQPGDFPAYGEFVYQGAYVYGIDLQNGFQLRGRISHLTDDDLRKSGQYGYDYSKTVRRILYSGDSLYTLSDSMLKASGIKELEERGSLNYPPLPEPIWNGIGSIDIMPLPATMESR
ncbi:hypothetical protein B1748_33275 [Paenibacillus sp. MY03]|uniref:beta-propeller domain-containing protein n=1 Tax=Paenibacillus sp. MY03 TaxID=302980 RepID=UPI000B3CF7C8|nr:beta-propeller domain-containing protein [Paenibacillus sp. MY03]OUS68612.1 hypothetical protein B1748_33275 [Paenibacillus sp. MY03]